MEIQSDEFYCSSKITSVVSETKLTMASLGYDLWDSCLIYYLCSIPCKTNLIPCFSIPDFVFPYRFIFYSCLCVSVSVCRVWGWLYYTRSQEAFVRSTGAGLQAVVSHTVWMLRRILWKSSICSYPLSHLFNHFLFFSVLLMLLTP